MNTFNVAFQATSHTTIHLLHPEMRRLTKRILRYFVRPAKININDVTATMFEEREYQLTDENFEIGETTKVLVVELTLQGEEHIVSKFYDHVRLFYSALVRTLFKKFPFQSTLLSDLFVLNQKERHNEEFPQAIVRIAKFFL